MHLTSHLKVFRRPRPLEFSVFKPIESELGQVKNIIGRQLSDSSEPVKGLLEYLNRAGGKMLRPALLILSGASTGKTTDRHIKLAAVVEMIHCSTLLHDDVIDDGMIRRGIPTVNRLWGSETAVLLGDFVLSKIFKLCAELEQKIVEFISSTAEQLCKGELREIMERENRFLSEQQYFEIINDKSASLFSVSCRLGAIASGAGPNKQKALGDFGSDIGMAYQIVDDLLDIIGEEKDEGKTLGNDTIKNRMTLPVIHLVSEIKKADNAVDRRVDEVWDNRSGIIDMLRQYGSVEYTRQKAEHFIRKAEDSLAIIPDSEAKTLLLKVAQYISDRAKNTLRRDDV